MLNLRSPDEAGYLSDEQQSEAAGLQYACVPLKASEVDPALTEEAIQEI